MWFQDDWAATNRLTLNLGVRYDLDLGVLGEDIEFLPWLSGNRPHDANNIAPRLGFAPADRTIAPVIRGGYGMFFTQLESDAAHQSELWTRTTIPQVLNDGRADFAVNPFNGPKPTYEQVLANSCDLTNNRAWLLPAVGHHRNSRAEREGYGHGPRGQLQPPGVGRRAAADRHRDGVRGQLRVYRRPRRRKSPVT